MKRKVSSPRLLAAVMLATLVGCGLRFYQLKHDGLWSDELFTTSMVSQHPLTLSLAEFRRTTVFDIRPGDVFWTAKGAEQSPPLFEILSKLSITLLGLNAFSMRLVSALAGCGWLVYLAVEALRSRTPRMARTLGFALVCSALSVPLVDYAQEARAYELGTLFTGILSVRWLLRWQAGFRSAPLPSWGELPVFVLACYTHYNALVFVALLLLAYGGVALASKRYRDFGKLCLVPVGFLPWAALNYHTVLFTAGGGVRWFTPTLSEALLGGLRCATELLAPAWGCGFVLALWVWLGRALFAKDGRPERDAQIQAYTLATLIALDVLLVALVSMRAGMLHPRYYLFALPLMHLLIASVVVDLVRKPVAISLCALALAATSISPLEAYYARDKEGYREITSWLRKRTPSDVPLVYTWGPNLAMYRFYFKRLFGPGADAKALPISSPREAHELCARLQDAPRVALIGHASHKPLLDEARDACKREYKLAAERQERDVVGEVWVHR
jgi:hypothetical protein